jgi:hypothetical protein
LFGAWEEPARCGTGAAGLGFPVLVGWSGKPALCTIIGQAGAAAGVAATLGALRIRKTLESRMDLS